jgi:LuxR family maltose regulon positive regulatory protein
VRADPQLSMAAAWALLATSQFDMVELRLQDIEQALGALADGSHETLALPADVRGGLAEVLCIRANLAFHRQDLARVLDLSQQALAYLTDDVDTGLFQARRAFEGVAWFNMALAHEFGGSVPAATEAFNQTLTRSRATNNPNLIYLAASHLAQLQVMQGQLHRAVDLYLQALELSTAHIQPLAGLAHTGLGSIFCEWNDLERAEAELTQGLDLGRKWSNWETVLPGYLGLARVRATQGDEAGAFALFDQAADFAHQSKASWGAGLIEAQRARLDAWLGNLDIAARWVQTCALDPEGDVRFAQEVEMILLARVLVAIGRLDEACRLTDKLLSSIEAGKRWGRAIEVLIVQSLALDAQGKRDEAVAVLARALKLAEPHGYVRVFADEGEPMAALLRGMKADGERMKSYAGTLLASFEQHPVSEKVHPSSFSLHPLTEPLSDRELQVLRCMADGMTNREIANKLVLSLNTVKTHIKNIHGKLDARNRTEAAARARELGLL